MRPRRSRHNPYRLAVVALVLLAAGCGARDRSAVPAASEVSDAADVRDVATGPEGGDEAGAGAARDPAAGDAAASQVEVPTPAFRNRLADAQSPYLLQHADNPVDW